MQTINIVDIEKSVLSTLFSEYEAFEKIDLASKDFYLPQHQKIFDAMSELYKEDMPIDEFFVLKKIGNEYQNDILNIIQATALANIKEYVDEIKEQSNKRQISTQLNFLRADIDNLSSTELLHKIENTFTKDENFIVSDFNIQNSKNIKAELPKFYLKDICPLQQNEINLISASGGSGKSYAALYLLLELQKNKNKVFGYFSEDSLSITKHRMQKIKEVHTHLKNVDIDIAAKDTRAKSFIEFNQKRNLIVSDFFYQFKKLTKNYNIIMIDPLITFIANDENSNSEARFLMNLLNEYCEKEQKTLIVIHHHSKSDESRGASAFIDAVRIHYVLKKKENNDSDRFLSLEKANHFHRNSNEFRIQLFKNEYEKNETTQTKSNITILDDDIESEKEKKKQEELEQKGFNFE